MRGPSSSSRLPFAHPNRKTDPSCKSPGPLDLLFSNIKHLFFQPCDDELIVVIHVHLKSPIMIGKKKAKDVQFIREATDVAFDETGNRKRKYRYGDEDEIQLEQEERKRRAQLNKEFKAFAERIAQAAEGDFEVDIPFRELGFQGVPFRTNVLLQPTTDALVQLTEMPTLVITLSEVEIVHFERVQHGLKQCVHSLPFGCDRSRPTLTPPFSSRQVRHGLCVQRFYAHTAARQLDPLWPARGHQGVARLVRHSDLGGRRQPDLVADPQDGQRASPPAISVLRFQDCRLTLLLRSAGHRRTPTSSLPRVAGTSSAAATRCVRANLRRHSDNALIPRACPCLQGSGSDESESGSEFDAGSDDDAVSSEESTDDESDFDSDASDDSGSAVSDESEGESWDELERRADKSDKKKREAKAAGGGGSDSEDDRRSSKKKSAATKSKGRR